MKNIYLSRHGEPERNKEDHLRKLTENGKSDIFKKAARIKELHNEIDSIFTSPYKRTRQTAEIYKIIFENVDAVIEDTNLTPGSDVEHIIETANSIDSENILFVAHNPELSYHVSYLTGESQFVEFYFGSVVKISFEDKVLPGTGKIVFKL